MMWSERLIFANARTRILQLAERDWCGALWNLDTEHVGAERRIDVDLRQREPEIEAIADGARKPDRLRQAVWLKGAVLSAPIAARRAAMRRRDDAPASACPVAVQEHFGGTRGDDPPIGTGLR